MNFKTFKKGVVLGVAVLAICALSVPVVFGQYVPGGTLVPTTIPKYVTPLVIPPVMNTAGAGGSGANYDIAVREFKQQILPGGIWNALSPICAATAGLCVLPETTVWSYGPAGDQTPAIAPAPGTQFNYPAYTIETTANTPVSVRWINELVANADDCFNPDGTLNPTPADPNSCNYKSHILPLDQTLHWANPPATDCRDGTDRTDCATNDPTQYTGPVPIVTHVHGAHVDPHSDGYPEAWWLPAANNIPGSYARKGSLFDDSTGANPGNLGYADYNYIQTQPATTLWYHDHSLGMTRNNVYAGPAGFWLIRGGSYDSATVGPAGPLAVLPGPAPVTGQDVVQLNDPTDAVRQSIREIPIVIQDRSFNSDGSLFYPDNRAFFEGLNVAGGPPPVLDIPFVPDSDIAPTWNPEAFFNVMVVNGVSWPVLEVAPALYRFRLLNGCNSRFLNLAMFPLNRRGNLQQGQELPFYQIGAEQGFLPQVVKIQTGYATPLPGNGRNPRRGTRAANADQALLMGLAERADVIVDFRGLRDGTRIRMINTAPDAPFGGFPDVPADPATTGQVMEFVVNAALDGASATDPAGATPATDPWSLVLNSEPGLGVASNANDPRNVSLNEEESSEVCVIVAPNGNVVALNLGGATFDPLDPNNICFQNGGVPFAPKAALLGQVAFTPLGPVGVPLKWTEADVGVEKTVTVPAGNVNVWVTENPALMDIEIWDIYNFTVDGHPIHLHLVRFEVESRRLIGAPAPAVGVGRQPSETGFKDTVIALPGEITRIKAKFDIAGLYVWHCHIVEHEDNEMMRPYFVGP